MSNRIFLRDIAILIISVLIAIFLFPGCAFIGYEDKKEKEEEKKIFGFLNGYNHRIEEAQTHLINAGFNPGPVDGSIDRNTREAVRDFQKANDLKATGIIDSKTWTKLSNYKVQVMPPDDVKKAQAALKAAGFGPGLIDGKLGPKTKKAILDFQAAKGLTTNGQLDSVTLIKLKAYFPAKDSR